MTLDVGERAPGFTLRDQHRQAVALADHAGRRAVLLVFYPLAFSGVCQGELTALQERIDELQNDRVQLLCVSVDSPYAHRVWAEQRGFSFPLLADFWPHGAVAQAYGCFDSERGHATRASFLVDRSGVVRWRVVHDLPVARDPDAYVAAIAAL